MLHIFLRSVPDTFPLPQKSRLLRVDDAITKSLIFVYNFPFGRLGGVMLITDDKTEEKYPTHTM